MVFKQCPGFYSLCLFLPYLFPSSAILLWTYSFVGVYCRAFVLLDRILCCRVTSIYYASLGNVWSDGIVFSQIWEVFYTISDVWEMLEKNKHYIAALIDSCLGFVVYKKNLHWLLSFQQIKFSTKWFAEPKIPNQCNSIQQTLMQKLWRTKDSRNDIRYIII